jgi:ferrochelatase
VRGLVDLVLERAAVERGEQVDRPALSPLGPSHDRCPAQCCPNLRDPGRPTLCGEPA